MDEGEAESIVLSHFVLWWCFNRPRMRGGGSGVESLIQSQLKSHLFPVGILAEAISMRHSHMLYGMDISTVSLEI